jgi:hypothetical protein
MTIHSATNVSTSYTYGFVWALIRLLVDNAGWTVSWSSNGTTGGAGGSYLTSANSLNHAAAYVVLRSPDNKEHFFRWNTTSAIYWDWHYSVGGLYTGGTATTDPTATDYQWVMGAMTVCYQSGYKSLMAADDQPPYGWWIMAHNPGDFGWQRGVLAALPVDAGNQPGETDPMVFFSATDGFDRASLVEEVTWWQYNHVSGMIPGASWQSNVPALAYYGGEQTIPSKLELDTNGADLSVPMPFGKRSPAGGVNGFKGFSTFIQWNGYTRAVGELFAGGSRISLGDANLPWDSATVPRS